MRTSGRLSKIESKLPHSKMSELIWDGKYKDGKKQGPVRIALPFQTLETVNESAQERGSEGHK